MSEKRTAQDRVEEAIDRIQDELIRGCMKVCSSKRSYPKDCINDGALETMAKRIIKLEAEVEQLRKAATR